jgi:hypothetical protein
MAFPLSIFQQRRPRIGRIRLDCTVTERHSASVEVSTVPIEDGAHVTDHADVKNRMLQLVGIITPTPDTIGAQFDRSGLHHINAHEQLLELVRRRELVTVFTPLESLEDCLVVMYDVDQSVDTSQALHFSATIQQIQLSKLGTVSRIAEADRDLGEADEDLGVQGTQEVVA